MVEICDEQMKVFMTKMYKLDNKLTEMQGSINSVEDQVKLGSFLSKKQAVGSMGISAMTVGLTLSIADIRFLNTSLFIFIAGLTIFIVSLFLKPKSKES